MYKEILQSIPGVSAYPLFSLFLFFAVFAIVLVWVFRMKKNYITHMSSLPLDSNTTQRDGE
jgi:hypothetical protein